MLPVLYSFRRCPYAIRARMTLRYCNIQVECREIIFADKPAEMLAVSPKGTVPVLMLQDGSVIDESLDVMYWALKQNDPEGWLIENNDVNEQINRLISENDTHFKSHLDHYKYADRFPEHSASYYRDQAEDYLRGLDDLLSDNEFLFAEHMTVADIAIFPFIRQFAGVDQTWFQNCSYPNLRNWLEKLTGMPLFTGIMVKQPPWNERNQG